MPRSPTRSSRRSRRRWIAQAAAAPNPGRPVAHRLNRTEYANAIRDLLALDVDGRSLLPADDTDQHGFDNNGEVLSISPALFERYLSAARKISRLAVGRAPSTPAIDTYTDPETADAERQVEREAPVWLARRRGDSAHLSGGRRIPDQDPAAKNPVRRGARVGRKLTISKSDSIASVSRSSPSAGPRWRRLRRALPEHSRGMRSGSDTRIRPTTGSK